MHVTISDTLKLRTNLRPLISLLQQGLLSGVLTWLPTLEKVSKKIHDGYKGFFV